jgi:hypothetical protein
MYLTLIVSYPPHIIFHHWSVYSAIFQKYTWNIKAWTGLNGFRIGSSGRFCEHGNESSGKLENAYLHRMSNYEFLSKEVEHVVSSAGLQLSSLSVGQSVSQPASQSDTWSVSRCYVNRMPGARTSTSFGLSAW